MRVGETNDTLRQRLRVEVADIVRDEGAMASGEILGEMRRE